MRVSSPITTLSTLALGSTLALAAPAQYCPQDKVCYSVAVPEAAAAASGGQGAIYLQLRAPGSYSWAALGQGTQMAGARIIVMYADGAGNVTVSARAGEGHALPQHDPSVNLELLAGSGVDPATGDMVANVRCGNCDEPSGSGGLASTSSDWIAAWAKGAPLDSRSADEGFQRHDGHVGWQFDLTRATVQADGNPYLSSSSQQGSSSSGSSAVKMDQDDGAAKWARVIRAHWIVMLFVWLVMYPLGSGLMPLLGKWWLHAAWQMLAFALMWGGFGLGWSAAHHFGTDFHAVHTQFGFAVIILISLQPVFGWLHHRHFAAHGRRSAVSHVHIWYGRILMLLGIINGGIGIQWVNKMAGATGGSVAVAWGVVGGVIGVVYLAAACFGVIRKKQQQQKQGADNGISLRNRGEGVKNSGSTSSA